MPSATPVTSKSALVAQGSASSRTGNALLYSPACIVVAGLAVRLACMIVGRSYQLDVKHWMAFEMANIGQSLALGHGFASPWAGDTGPTAWTAPVYPWLVSLAFRTFGVFSHAAAFALFSFNSLFSALTSWTIYRIARRVFNQKVAVWSGWLWALFPYAIYWSVIWIWETTLTAFLLSLLFLRTLEMEGDNRLRTWAGYGLLWGVVALVNTSALSWLPFAGCWLAYRLYRQRKGFLLPVALSAVVFWAVITPWLVRNYTTFHALVFIRGDLGSELRVGNNPMAQGTWVPGYRPGNNISLSAEYRHMGEVAFNAEQGRLARAWIVENPQRFLGLSCRRFFYFWYGLPEALLGFFQPLYIALSLLGGAGLLLALWRRVHGAFLFATLLVVYPLVYYITFATDRYRHPIEPELLILAVWVLLLEKQKKSATGEDEPQVAAGE